MHPGLFAMCFALLFCMGLAQAHATSSFIWTEPWQVTLLPKTCGGPQPFCDNLVGRAFGSSATVDGQIRDVSADVAVAKSQWGAGTGQTSGGTGLTFSRTFQLSNAPQGWTVGLSGALNGSLEASNQLPGLPQVLSSVEAEAAISTSPLHLTWSETDVGASTGPPTVNPIAISQLQGQTALFSDGTYTLTGRLFTTAGGVQAIALSDFFTTGLQVSVTATAVPEPSTYLLLGSGIAWFAWRNKFSSM
jgi:hypothetical protein